jgi:Protein kinase domain
MQSEVELAEELTRLEQDDVAYVRELVRDRLPKGKTSGVVELPEHWPSAKKKALNDFLERAGFEPQKTSPFRFNAPPKKRVLRPLQSVLELYEDGLPGGQQQQQRSNTIDDLAERLNAVDINDNRSDSDDNDDSDDSAPLSLMMALSPPSAKRAEQNEEEEKEEEEKASEREFNDVAANNDDGNDNVLRTPTQQKGRGCVAPRTPLTPVQAMSLASSSASPHESPLVERGVVLQMIDCGAWTVERGTSTRLRIVVNVDDAVVALQVDDSGAQRSVRVQWAFGDLESLVRERGGRLSMALRVSAAPAYFERGGVESAAWRRCADFTGGSLEGSACKVLVQFYSPPQCDKYWSMLMKSGELRALVESSLLHHYTFASGELGRGSWGSVRRARHNESGVDYAIKVFDKSKFRLASQIERIRAEYEIMKKLEHPHIIAVREMFESPTHLYIVMELAEGGELFDEFDRRAEAGTGFSESEARLIVAQLLDALAYLHNNNRVHRDVKVCTYNQSGASHTRATNSFFY